MSLSTWQDWAIALVGIYFAFALIPSIRSQGEKPPFFTSFTTALGLLITGVALFTAGLWFSAATTLLSVAAWSVLAYQKVKQ